MNSSDCDHLSQDLIFRSLDDELTKAERFDCELHLAVCEDCRQKLAELREFSSEIEATVHATPIPAMESGRIDLVRALEGRRSTVLPIALQHPAKVMRRFGLGMGIAATLALGVLLAPKHDFNSQTNIVQPVEQVAAVAQSTAIEVDGESFVPVPYSNADLPMSTPHIVQMQVPVSSLADVGIVLEPVTNRFGDSDRSVLADVLMGADGQPRGVHVLEFE